MILQAYVNHLTKSRPVLHKCKPAGYDNWKQYNFRRSLNTTFSAPR